MIDDEATVKRIRLQPENNRMEPIYTDHAQLLGKVCDAAAAVLREGTSHKR